MLKYLQLYIRKSFKRPADVNSQSLKMEKPYLTILSLSVKVLFIILFQDAFVPQSKHELSAVLPRSYPRQ